MPSRGNLRPVCVCVDEEKASSTDQRAEAQRTCCVRPRDKAYLWLPDARVMRPQLLYPISLSCRWRGRGRFCRATIVPLPSRSGFPPSRMRISAGKCSWERGCLGLERESRFDSYFFFGEGAADGEFEIGLGVPA